MKSKLYTFNPTIYPFRLVVTKSFDEDELRNRFSRAKNKTEFVDLEDGDLSFGVTECAKAMTAADHVSNWLTVLVVINGQREDISNGAIAHEALHAVTDMAMWFGFPDLANYTSEPYCYLVEWITDCIHSTYTGDPKSMGGELLK